ncbi:MAG: S-methyl-5'-thioadenosine phosphorylase [Spirochaetota bacterium]
MSLAFIGGTGIYRMEGVEDLEELRVDTPFGPPSDLIKRTRVGGREVFFLPRHGAGHRLLPSEIPARANIWALKKLGVTRVIGVSAVGSLKEDIRPRDIVIPSQVIDRTRSRPSTFFGDGVVGHVSFADPFCPDLAGLLYDCVQELDYRVHRGETYVCMEGPAFSTRAESTLYRSWGGGVIGMTALPEAKLAREAELCYAVMATSTDYDCWKEEEEAVTVDMIVQNIQANTRAAHAVLARVIQRVPETADCGCGEAARHAILTDPSRIPREVRERLRPLYGKYWD